MDFRVPNLSGAFDIMHILLKYNIHQKNKIKIKNNLKIN